jgi:hypothetical protein
MSDLTPRRQAATNRSGGSENEIARVIVDADLIVGDRVLVERNSVERLAPVHAKQLLTYLRLLDQRLGLLVNFGAALMKDGIKRVVNGLDEEGAPRGPRTPRSAP